MATAMARTTLSRPHPTIWLCRAQGCHDVDADISDSLKLIGSEVHHHNYFAHQQVRERLARWLCL